MTREQHDTKAALEWIEEQIAISRSRGIGHVPVYETIKRALGSAAQEAELVALKKLTHAVGTMPFQKDWPDDLCAAYNNALKIIAAQKEDKLS